MCVIHKRDKVSCVCFQRQRERDHRMPSGTQVACECKEPNHSSNSNPFHEFGQGEKPNEALFNWPPLSLSLFLVLLFSHSVVYTRGTCPDRQQWTFGPSLCVFTYYKDRKGIALFDL